MVTQHNRVIDPTSARQGEKSHVVRYILAFSTMAAVVSMLVVYFLVA